MAGKAEDVQEIVIRPPDKRKPGYLKRVRQAMGIQKRMAGEGGVEAFDEMLDFLLENSEVQVPDGVEPREALMELSQEEYESIFQSFIGVDPQSGA